MPKDTHSTLPADAELVLPDQVTVALAELAGAARQGLLVLAVGTGLGVLGSLLDTDVERLVGPGAATTRSGPWSVTAPSPAESPSAAAGFGSTGRGSAARRHRRAGSAHLAGVRWDRAVGPARGGADAGQAVHPPLPPWLEPVGSRAEPASSGTSRSAVSRRFVAATERALAELLAADLSGLELVALLIDGIRVADHTCVVALGITLDGTKVPLALAEGATENTTVVGELLAGLRDRGLDTTRPTLVVLDGATALRRAVTEVFDHPSFSAASCIEAVKNQVVGVSRLAVAAVRSSVAVR
jgi:putative transposase